MTKRLLLLLTIACGIWAGCTTQNSNKNQISEGVITYQVEYLCDQKANPIVTLLPTQVDLKFKNNNISLNSEGYLGFFSTRFLSQYKEKSSHILLRVLNNKFDYEFARKEIPFIYQNEPHLRIEYCDSTKNIAGLNCRMAIIHSPDKRIAPIKVFYTHEINLKDPNRNTPFKNLNGVLMEFETQMHNINTRFVATQVSAEEVPEIDFEIPENYQEISCEEIKKYLLNFK